MDQPLHREHGLQLDPAVFGCHTVRLPGGDVIICVHGEIDCFTAPTLQACLEQQFAAPSRAGGVEVALAHTTFVGARGISTLLAAVHTARLQATAFRITGCSPQLLRVIDIVGLSDVLAASLERPRHSGLGDCPFPPATADSVSCSRR
jgi:anti-anti-sigma factor